MAKKELKIKEIEPIHARILEEYFNNGHNKTQAVLKLRPNIKYSSCTGMFDSMIKRPEVASYLENRHRELKEAGKIESLDIMYKLKMWLNSDPSQFIGLTPDDVKQLPADVRQCIQSIDHKKKTYVNRLGEHVTEEHIKVQLVDKVKTMDMLNKHIGFYSEDNKQKGNNTNILIQNLASNNPDALLSLLKAIDESKEVE